MRIDRKNHGRSFSSNFNHIFVCSLFKRATIACGVSQNETSEFKLYDKFDLFGEQVPVVK